MTNLVLAKNKLIENEYTCVITKEQNVIFKSRDKGIKPLLDVLLENENSIQGAFLADKIIGKAAALLVAFGGVKEVYAHVVGDCAKLVLEKNDIKVEYNRIVPYIMNRDGTDKCPMEKLVENTEDPKEAFEQICSFIGIRREEIIG